MIVRVQGSGQYRLGPADVETMHGLDHQLLDAVHAQDQQRVHGLLDTMIDLVQSKGSPIGLDELVTSEVVLPPDTLTVEEVAALLHEEGLVPSGAGQEQ